MFSISLLIYSSQLQILLVSVQVLNPNTTQYLTILHTSSNSSEISNSSDIEEYLEQARSIYCKTPLPWHQRVSLKYFLASRGVFELKHADAKVGGGHVTQNLL